MFLIFAVKWACSCGCETTHVEFFGRHEEALEAVVELQEGQAKKIAVVRMRLPRRKGAIIAALNEVAGNEVEGYADCETLACLVREDCVDNAVEGDSELVH